MGVTFAVSVFESLQKANELWIDKLGEYCNLRALTLGAFQKGESDGRKKKILWHTHTHLRAHEP